MIKSLKIIHPIHAVVKHGGQVDQIELSFVADLKCIVVMHQPSKQSLTLKKYAIVVYNCVFCGN